ncbi:hypothetical protein, partial [Burkholderia cenocepacia]
TTKSPASLPGSGPVLGALMSGRCRDRTALARSGSLTTGPTGVWKSWAFADRRYGRSPFAYADPVIRYLTP